MPHAACRVLVPSIEMPQLKHFDMQNQLQFTWSIVCVNPLSLSIVILSLFYYLYAPYLVALVCSCLQPASATGLCGCGKCTLIMLCVSSASASLWAHCVGICYYLLCSICCLCQWQWLRKVCRPLATAHMRRKTSSHCSLASERVSERFTWLWSQ